EPTTMVDPIMAAHMGDLITRLKHAFQKTSIVVTHDTHLARKLADKVVFLQDGNDKVFESWAEFESSDDPFLVDFRKQDALISAMDLTPYRVAWAKGFRGGSLRVKRREFLKALSSMPLAAAAPALLAVQPGVLVNDAQTGWNPTIVERIERPRSAAEIQAIVRDCARSRQVLSISASRHATGGQQFAAASVLLDLREMNAIRGLDLRTGIFEVESGIEWPELIEGYLSLQKNDPRWGIRQKQGGADRMSLGGALAANAHGHCLGAPPIVADVEWIEIVTADGKLHRCTRKQERELFSLAIGGYGLFGVITAAGLRLAPRRKVRRRVETRTAAELMGLIERRTKA